MQTLTLDPAVPLRIPPDRPLAVTLVGCGGTGSHVATTLARLAHHCRASGLPPLHLTFVDGDQVEPKNVGRQLFAPADVGRNKAQALAARLSSAFGLVIDALPEMATPALLGNLGIAHRGRESPYRVLVGCVDGPAGRRAMDAALTRGDVSLWVDCGNHEHDGQVCAGTIGDRRALAGTFALGLCAGLPGPALQLPALLDEPAAPLPTLDCAEAVAANAQALQINQLVATVAGQYLAELAVHRRLSVFQTWVDLAGLGMRSLPCTARQVAQALGVDPGYLTTSPTKKGRAA